jgi:hypothetical protein
MTVIRLEQCSHSGEWRKQELNTIVGALTPVLARGDAGGWDVGATENGDPQFYLLGSAPHENCEICISRVGRTYILEDGEGRLLLDTGDLSALAERAAATFRSNRAQIVARVMVAWCVAKQFFHDRVEPMLAEGEEFFEHVAPQFAAFA